MSTKKYSFSVQGFADLKSLDDVAHFLNFAPKKLSYILYKLDEGRENQYIDFTIPKKSGKRRQISAPKTALKEVQRRLNEKLQKVYWKKPVVHSFIKERSIVSNALNHRHKKYIFNIDLKDFFPSINFGRVRGLFIKPPYSLPPSVATVFAQIACYKNSLPQGSPCSPIISNMICSRMDEQLKQLAGKEKCWFTRYADDITFSTNLKNFPEKIGITYDDGVTWETGAVLEDIILSNGFIINQDKVKMQTPDMRQEVTGLIVNEFVNVRRNLIRQVRAMLHAWEIYGLEAAENEYHTKYSTLENDDKRRSFRNVVRGKIEFIRYVRSQYQPPKNENKQKKGYIAQRLLLKYFECVLRDNEKTVIRTEGHTDWIHLKIAWEQLSKQKKYVNNDFAFFNLKESKGFGNGTLMSFCKNATQLRPFKNKIICVFDSDDKQINKEHKQGGIRSWGNNVFSFILPELKEWPKGISIEMFHYKKTLKLRDEKGRRLFLSDEFDKNGRHKKEKDIIFGYNPKIGKIDKKIDQNLKIIDQRVYKKTAKGYQSVAMSKAQFAVSVRKKEGTFKKINFGKFNKIFDLICEIEKR
jgi:RNA-directed DNA polymerase